MQFQDGDSSTLMFQQKVAFLSFINKKVYNYSLQEVTFLHFSKYNLKHLHAKMT